MTNTAIILKNNDAAAIQKVLYYANEEQSIVHVAELMRDGSLTMTDVTRSGRRVCWFLRDSRSIAIYCDTLDELTEEEKANDIL